MDVCELQQSDIDIVPELLGSRVSCQYLMFMVSDAVFAVDILKVLEIRNLGGVTRIPNVADHVLGVINLRGSIVPVIDLNKRFSLTKNIELSDEIVIVLTVASDGFNRDMAIKVDGVFNVFDFLEEDIKTTPTFRSDVPTEFIEGLSTVDGQMVALLDVDRLLNSEELGSN